MNTYRGTAEISRGDLMILLDHTASPEAVRGARERLQKRLDETRPVEVVHRVSADLSLHVLTDPGVKILAARRTPEGAAEAVNRHLRLTGATAEVSEHVDTENWTGIWWVVWTREEQA